MEHQGYIGIKGEITQCLMTTFLEQNIDKRSKLFV